MKRPVGPAASGKPEPPAALAGRVPGRQPKSHTSNFLRNGAPAQLDPPVERSFIVEKRGRAVPDQAALEMELLKLHERRGALEERIRFAQARGRYGGDSMAEEGREDEGAAIVELDRLMTRIRAVEGKLALMRRGMRPPVG